MLAGYAVWALVIATLPVAVYLYVRSRRRSALAMLLAAAMVWGGTIAGLTAEPELVEVQESDGTVAMVYTAGSDIGSMVLVTGAILFVVAGLIHATTGRGGSKG